MIKRYDIDPRPGHFDMVRDDDGYYVRYADIAHLLEEKTLEQHRAEFEEWAVSNYLRTGVYSDGIYSDLITAGCWQAWKAAKGIKE